ncbi:Domain of uncharacterised function (DUF2825) [Chromobacterium violaceum]|uniref:Domain of uncharacterized function (DUF2825) n=1 Tax=Chromobacterium violaceum TaxID=536 RepID=A0AAX2MA89_CHRVL|nr:Domain of uncharacterised function (DUF2825) [Chromobacterium violaceum]
MPARWTVHPHGRGEHEELKDAGNEPVGSSPRAWGTRQPVMLAIHDERFIPTGVGNTPIPASPLAGNAVHPHGRGEHTVKLTKSPTPTGSSPRAWGTRSSIRKRMAAPRFIPTGVGNTPAAASSPPSSPVHPHGRGEHLAYLRALRTRSPVHPHGRGEHSGNHDLLRLRRGSSPRAWEHRSQTTVSLNASGSSPRAWGTLHSPSWLPLP